MASGTAPHPRQAGSAWAGQLHTSLGTGDASSLYQCQGIEWGQCREGGGTIALSFVAQMEQSLMMHSGTAVMPGLCAHHMGRRLSFGPTSLQRLIMLWPKMLNSSQW